MAKIFIKRKTQISKFQIGLLITLLGIIAPLQFSSAQEQTDADNDGLSDYEEINIYRSNPFLPDTDEDGYNDGTEIKYNYDLNKSFDDKLEKIIGISIKDQTLTYSLGHYAIKTIKISSGLPRTPTPTGEFTILKKPAFVTYKGPGYFYPNTRWNMLFKTSSRGGYYIHGAYWHNNFGKPMSHGCVNVSYADVEALYNWADEGTKVIIE